MRHTDLLLDLTRRYCEPQRHYHTLEHIAYLLMMGRDQDLSEEQTLAIWFHDAIYEVRSKTNEIDSAALAVEMMQADEYPAASVQLVRQIVLDSEQHIPTTELSAKVIDLDLSPLAASAEIYQRNATNIRREHDWLESAEFDRNLRRFVENLLARERIFWTPWGAGLEAAARRNLQQTLDQLT